MEPGEGGEEGRRGRGESVLGSGAVTLVRVGPQVYFQGDLGVGGFFLNCIFIDGHCTICK